MRDPVKEAMSSNFHPIACLCTTQKLLLGFITDEMSRNMANYMSKV